MSPLQLFGTATSIQLILAAWILAVVFHRRILAGMRTRADEYGRKIPFLAPAYRLIADMTPAWWLIFIVTLMAGGMIATIVVGTIEAVG